MNYCVIIPNYNHTHGLDKLLAEIAHYQLPIIMINDGSDDANRAILESLVSKVSQLTLLHHPQNQGKGGAVQTGLKYAYQQGFSHAIQIDADGQHNVDDFEQFITASKQQPTALISGLPVYDESIPKHRLYARNITHFWVWVETLSFAIKDTMCGFRVYPLALTQQLLNTKVLGKRMDFDIEIMVRLYWLGAKITFIPTKVAYPEHGISHFRGLEDNLLISWLHTRLCFGMLWRAPKLLYRSWSRA